MKKPIVIAHRGASAYAPENTMSAFIRAMEMGAGGIELDVQLTRDEYPVVIHDETIDRTGNGSGWVGKFTFLEISSFDFGSWFGTEFENERIPSLEAVLKLLNSWDGLLNIEIKNSKILYPGIEEKVVELIRKYNMESRTIVSSFNHYSLAELKKLAPELKTAPLYDSILFEPWEYAKKLGAYAIHPAYCNIIPQVMEGCKRCGIRVNPYTIDEPKMIKKAAIAGVDGIITNVPDKAINALKEI